MNESTMIYCDVLTLMGVMVNSEKNLLLGYTLAIHHH